MKSDNSARKANLSKLRGDKFAHIPPSTHRINSNSSPLKNKQIELIYNFIFKKASNILISHSRTIKNL